MNAFDVFQSITKIETNIFVLIMLNFVYVKTYVSGKFKTLSQSRLPLTYQCIKNRQNIHLTGIIFGR